MYRLKFADTVEYFETKDEAKDAAQEDWGPFVLKWKVRRDQKGNKVGIKAGPYRIKKIKSEKIGKEILKAGPGPGALDDPRTAREFVEDMISAGRTHIEVLAVARSCRWEHHLPAVKAVLEEFSKN